MAGFETIIRPFQNRTAPAEADFELKKFTPMIVLSAGKGGRGRTIQGTYSVNAQWYADAQVTEAQARVATGG